MRRFFYVMFLFLLVFVSAYSEDVTGTKGIVKSAINGRTIELMNGLKVELLGITDSPGSQEYLEKHLVGKKVLLIADSKDKLQTYKSVQTTVRAYVRETEGAKTAVNGHMLRSGFSKKDLRFVQDSLTAWSKIKDHDDGGDLPPDQLFTKISSATFLIGTYKSSGEPDGTGTGFFINDEGLALTNNHVLENTNGHVFPFVNGKPASNNYRKVRRIIYTNKKLDFTIFLVDLDPAEKTKSIRISKRLPNVGTPVATLGNPLGQMATFSTGEVSAHRLEDAAIQFNAPINRGNSGGPVVDFTGAAVGIATSVRVDPDGKTIATGNLNFAVDIQTVRKILDEMNLRYEGK